MSLLYDKSKSIGGAAAGFGTPPGTIIGAAALPPAVQVCEVLGAGAHFPRRLRTMERKAPATPTPPTPAGRAPPMSHTPPGTKRVYAWLQTDDDSPEPSQQPLGGAPTPKTSAVPPKVPDAPLMREAIEETGATTAAAAATQQWTWDPRTQTYTQTSGAKNPNPANANTTAASQRNAAAGTTAVAGQQYQYVQAAQQPYAVATQQTAAAAPAAGQTVTYVVGADGKYYMQPVAAAAVQQQPARQQAVKPTASPQWGAGWA